MLILGRREGESILIEGGIRIVIVSCERGGVRIGIEAPAETKILRGEIAKQVEVENMRATTASPDAAPWISAIGIKRTGNNDGGSKNDSSTDAS